MRCDSRSHATRVCGEKSVPSAGDCASLVCQGHHCVITLCGDGVYEAPSESDVDCGTFCGPCPDGASCYLGTDCRGLFARPNNIGVYLIGSNNGIVGNLISGNQKSFISPGIRIGAGSANNVIANNFIGTDRTGAVSIFSMSRRCLDFIASPNDE